MSPLHSVTFLRASATASPPKAIMPSDTNCRVNPSSSITPEAPLGPWDGSSCTAAESTPPSYKKGSMTPAKSKAMMLKAKIQAKKGPKTYIQHKSSLSCGMSNLDSSSSHSSSRSSLSSLSIPHSHPGSQSLPSHSTSVSLASQLGSSLFQDGTPVLNQTWNQMMGPCPNHCLCMDGTGSLYKRTEASEASL